MRFVRKVTGWGHAHTSRKRWHAFVVGGVSACGKQEGHPQFNAPPAGKVCASCWRVVYGPDDLGYLDHEVDARAASV